uniref:Uncharacterized protein n=1 Tax=Pseudomonas putida TaxID=303 RepID=A0A6B7PWQ0_PSEPU|nr:hypothetical protein [Pseudomonas putida]
MATILSHEQQQRREDNELSMQPINRAKPPTVRAMILIGSKHPRSSQIHPMLAG